MNTERHLERPRGHAFISYVREDSDRVDQLVELLEDAGIRVWRDKDDIAPGQDWKGEIHRAITDGALAFIACFSSNSEQRDKTYQNEELLVAVEEMRLRPVGRTWFIPVRFDVCNTPEYEIGAGRTLRSIQHLDLFEEGWERSTRRLIASVAMMLGASNDHGTKVSPASSSPTVSTVERARRILLDPTRRIELEDLFSDAVSGIRDILSDNDNFPTTLPVVDGKFGVVRYLASQAHRYADVASPVAELLVAGCAYGNEQQDSVWARSVQNIASARKSQTGGTALINLQSFPIVLIVYCSALAANFRRNYGALRAVTTDATFRNIRGERNPIIGAIHTAAPFEDFPIAASLAVREAEGASLSDDQLTAMQTRHVGLRLTPVSDYMYTRMRPLFAKMLPDDDDYTEEFNLMEIILGMIAIHEAQVARASGRHIDGAWYGSFTWRDRWADNNAIENRVLRQIVDSGDEWPGLKAGLFSGSAEAAAKAATDFVERAKEVRSE